MDGTSEPIEDEKEEDLIIGLDDNLTFIDQRNSTTQPNR